MTSLFTVDGDAMAEAFQVDESMFQVDLSGLSNLNLDTSAISGAFQIDADSLDLTNLLDFEDLSELTEDLQQDLQNLTKDLDLSMSQRGNAGHDPGSGIWLCRKPDRGAAGADESCWKHQRLSADG